MANKGGTPEADTGAVDASMLVFDESVGFFPREIFAGKMGELPLLMCVNVGYDPYDPDPFMHYYESEEVLFAYKKDAQKRVLMTDSHGRTLSLPLHSTLPFRLQTDRTEKTMAQIVSAHRLPVTVLFARAECLDIIVDKRAADHRFFGALTVTSVYDEPYMWCLALDASGKPAPTPVVLPRNLNAAGFSPVVAIRGASNSAARVREVIRHYSQLADKVDYQQDPFFQELAFVSRGPEPVEKIEPYIDHNTFIPITITAGKPASSRAHPPRPPPREGKELAETWYDSPNIADDEEHVYSEPRNNDVKPETKIVRPFKMPSADLRGSAEGKVGSPPLPDSASRGKSLMQPPAVSRTSPREPKAPPPLPERRDPSETAGGDPQKSQPALMAAPRKHGLMDSPHLKSLSVEDVGHKLKELGLEKYAKKFRKSRIDGLLLQKVTEEDLKTQFKMNPMEILVLQTFVTEGHIPQTSTRKTSSK